MHYLIGTFGQSYELGQRVLTPFIDEKTEAKIDEAICPQVT